MNFKILFYVLLLSLLSLQNTYAGIDQRIQEMLEDGQSVADVHDKNLGLSLVSIGIANHSNSDIARSMAKEVAMKELATYLKGINIHAIERAETRSAGDSVEEFYSSLMESSIETTMHSAYLYKSGVCESGHYAAVILSEKSTADANFFNKKMEAKIQNAKGYSSLKDGISKARKRALNEALRNAVEQYSGVQLASKTTIEDATSYKAKLASVSKGRVSKYDITSEGNDGENYFVCIVAEISEEDPKASSNIDAIKESLGRPVFYLDILDTNLSDLISTVLSKNDLSVTDTKSRAKYIVKATVRKHEYDVPMAKTMKGIQTAVTIDVSDVYSGEDFIHIDNDPSASVDISEHAAVRERNSYNYAMEEIEDKLVSEIKRKFVSTFQNGSKVVVKLVQIDRMRDVKELKECIESLPMTKSVTVSPVKSGMVEYEVIYLGNPSELQLATLERSMSFRLRGLKVKQNKAGEIWFTF